MREHLVAERETCDVLADRGDDTCRFDTECQRWLSADVPLAHADELVPVADACGAHRDHELVRRGRSGRRELERVNLAAERVDAGGSYPTPDPHPPGPRLRPAVRRLASLAASADRCRFRLVGCGWRFSAERSASGASQNS